MMNIKSPKTNAIADGLMAYLSWIKNNRIRNCTQRQTVINRGKRSKTPNEVKKAKFNTNKNPQTFLMIISMQKEVLPSHKLQGHAYELQNPF